MSSLPSTHTREVLADLNEIRLRNDWSIRELAAAMGAAGYHLSSRTLYVLLKERESHEPYDRTLYKVERYVERCHEHDRRSERHKLIAAAAKAAATRAAKRAQRESA
jgi:hypothetical protein